MSHTIILSSIPVPDSQDSAELVPDTTRRFRSRFTRRGVKGIEPPPVESPSRQALRVTLQAPGFRSQGPGLIPASLRLFLLRY